MSHLTLQRVMVRMLYDPDFATHVQDDPSDMLDSEDLTKAERAYLRGPDPRAWRADPDRPRRSLSVLLQEYPTSFAVAHRAMGTIEPLERFFRSSGFHRCVRERGSMGLEFGGYLEDLARSDEVGDRRVVELARLEREIARLRRRTSSTPSPVSSAHGSSITIDSDPVAVPGRTRWRLSPDKSLHLAAGGTADLHEAIHLGLSSGGSPLTSAVLDPMVELPGSPLDPSVEEPLLLELAEGSGPRVKLAVAATEITRGLYDLLAHAEVPRAFDDMVTEIVRLGADTEDGPEVIDSLIGDGTLTP